MPLLCRCISNALGFFSYNFAKQAVKIISASALSLPVNSQTVRESCSGSEVQDGKGSASLPFLDNNPFVAIPEAWVTNLATIEEERKNIISLHPNVFRTVPRIDILHRNIVWQLMYRNLQMTKQLTRGEMPGGGRKPWPQKKMGRHHAGSIRAPHFAHGGFAHGVRGPHTWFYMLPDTIRLEGLCVALTIKHVQNDLVIVDNFASLASNEPRYLLDIAETRNWGYSVLFVNNSADVDAKLVEACNEIPSFNIMPVYGLNCYSIMKYETVVVCEEALEILQSRILYHKHRVEPLHKKYRYEDMKTVLLNEAEKELDSKFPPFI